MLLDVGVVSKEVVDVEDDVVVVEGIQDDENVVVEDLEDDV